MKKESPLSFHVEPALRMRLEECSKRIHIKKYTLALLAIEAAVDAIEQNEYRLVVPIKFEVAQVPAAKNTSQTSYRSHQPALNEVRETPADAAPPTTKKKRAA